jgi:Flp pilus assembly protein TadB
VSSRTGRQAGIGVGVVALLVGLLWIGQGLGYLPGSFMTGSLTWFWVGLVVAALGVLLLVRSLRRRRPSR